MKVLTATLTLLVSTAVTAQECPTCSMVDACIATYLKAASEVQRDTKVAIRDWQQNLDRKASAEFSNRGHDRITKHHGFANSYGAWSPEGVLG
jgi:hypothetical protein